METSLRNIAGLLGSMGRDLDIESVSKRKLLQKLVYLGQSLGLPTNYNFSWYIHGPYSPRLTKDYYELESELNKGSAAKQTLSDAYARIANELNGLLEERPAEKISEADWAELLASIIFLRKESGYDEKETLSTIQSKKPHVSDFFDGALKRLSSRKLV